MARRNTKAALLAATALTETAIETLPNAATPIEVLPLAADTHHNIETTLASIVENERAIDYARQKLAHLLFERHAQKVAADTDNKVPFAHDIAENQGMFDIYLSDLTAEFKMPDADRPTAMDDASRLRKDNRIRQRLDRALRLFVNLAWLKANRPSENCTWDADAGRWNLSPWAFCAPDHKPSADLLTVPKSNTPRAFIPLENIDAAEYYFVQKGKSANVSINVSLDQLNYAVGEHIKAKRNPLAPSAEATPQRQARATRLANANKKAQADAAAADVAAEDSDTPEATAAGAQTDRVWAIGQLMRLFIGIEKILNHDALGDLSWADFTLEGYNGAEAWRMKADHMNALPNGKANRLKVGGPEAQAKAA